MGQLTAVVTMCWALLGRGCAWFGPPAPQTAESPPVETLLAPRTAPLRALTRFTSGSQIRAMSGPALPVRAGPGRGGGGLAEGTIGISARPRGPMRPPPPRVLTTQQRARVLVEPPVVSIGLAASRIHRAVRARMSAMRRCYVERLGTRTVEGRLTARILVGPDGQVAVVAVDTSTLADPPLEACVRGEMTGWRFPLPPAGGPSRFKLSVTFKLRPQPTR